MFEMIIQYKRHEVVWLVDVFKVIIDSNRLFVVSKWIKVHTICTNLPNVKID